MKDKREVYSGYDEKYLTGDLLKKELENTYYSDGRHHARVMGLSIPDYLTLIGIKDDVTYRIFLNKNFCKVMDKDTDREITFFGHTPVDNIKMSHRIDEINTELICPECGSSMEIKNSKYGMFIGCSDYPKCKHKQNIINLGNYINV